jgi:outer membrane protein
MRYSLIAALVVAAAQPLAAQPADTAAGPTLSLEDALNIARRNNPAHRQIVNNQRPADLAVRSAFVSLLVPDVDAAVQSSFREGGASIFNGASLGASSDVMSSAYDIGVTYRFNAAKLLAPRLEAANADAARADIVGSTEALRSTVTQQYLTVLQAQENAELQDTLVATARVQLQLANAREAAGSATQLDVRRAEVSLGQAQVAALRAHNTVEIEKLRLFQQMGVQQPADVRLTSAFTVTPPALEVQSLLDMARRANPGLNALRAREKAASVSLRSTQSQYTPTLTVSTGWSGYTQQFTDDAFPVEQARMGTLANRAGCFTQDSIRVGAGLSSIAAECSAISFTPDDAARIRSQNNQYPFDFQKSPWSLTATLSIPLFDGLQREQRIEQAHASRADAQHEVRARELALVADVTGAHLTLITAARAVELQTENAAKAREELAFAEERYRVGAATFLDVVTARSSFEQAESDRITAIYDYHKAFAALENAVGRPLR